MNVYFAILLPLLAGLLLIFFFSKRVTWWEVLLPSVASFILIFIMKVIMVSYNTHDTEYLSFSVSKAVYEEPWNEYIHKTCSYTTTSGSGKNSHTTTHYYDCSYVDYHKAKWYLVDINNNTYSISKNDFEQNCIKWKNRNFQDMNRPYYTIDGDAYVSYWNQDISVLLTAHQTHSYENRVQACSTIYNFPNVTEDDKSIYQLYDYPQIGTYKQNCVLSKFYPITDDIQDYVNTINARLGKTKQLQLFICLFITNESSGEYQEYYWNGGNKNEMNVNVGIDPNGHIRWCYVYTWSEKSIAKIELRNWFTDRIGKKLDLKQFTDYAYSSLNKNWVRKEFHDFDYLDVGLTSTQITWIYICTILMTLGCSIFAVLNEFNPEYDNTKQEKFENNLLGKWKVFKYRIRNNWRKLKQKYKNR